ncbi:transposase [[Clostridium] spiroforme]|nr:transposase [Thomasclavelia spiroformis]
MDYYSSCQLTIFKEFSELLKRHRKDIVNSFIYIIARSQNARRLSSGPMEEYNRTPKDFKRNSRRLTNFEYARSRLIWTKRKNEAVLTTPKSKKKVYKFKK